jgi:ATP synthase F1 delta subunit
MPQPATVAGVYAEALVQAAAEANAVEPVLSACRDLLAGISAELIGRLDDPRLGKPQAEEALVAAASDAPPAVVNLLRLCVQKNRLPDLRAILADAVRRAEEHLGRIHVTVISSAPLPPTANARITDEVRRILGPNAVIDRCTDPALIGGLTVRVGDLFVDASVKRRIAEMRAHMLTAPVSDDIWADATTR